MSPVPVPVLAARGALGGDRLPCHDGRAPAGMSFLALLATLDAGCPAPRREAASGVAAAYQSTSAGARGGWADILDPQLDRIGVAGCFGASSTTRPSMEVAITEDLRRCKRISRTATAS